MTNTATEQQLARLDELEHRFAEAVERAKLEAIKELAYGAGHEINNPLANIATRAQTLLREETDPEKRRKLAAINAQAFRAHEMIADLMLFARPPEMRPEPVELSGLLKRLADELQAEAEAAAVQIEVKSSSAPVQAMADPVQIVVALRAMCINSIQAMSQGGRLELGCQTATADEVQITVADTGPGIPAEIRTKIFDPFFSGREAGRGLGFGLSKAWRLITLHGGSIVLDETAGRGARFVITLPRNCLEGAAPLTTNGSPTI
jgi:signal transduction histidine kinase